MATLETGGRRLATHPSRGDPRADQRGQRQSVLHPRLARNPHGQGPARRSLPTGPMVPLATARRLRSIIKTGDLSEEAVRLLTPSHRELEPRSEDPEARDAENRAALKSTTTVDSKGIAGINVYALPHYLRYPDDHESGHTLPKVGHSSRDVISRFKNQTRATALPEEPVSLGIYVVGDEASNAVERQFHQFLAAADHECSAARTGAPSGPSPHSASLM